MVRAIWPSEGIIGKEEDVGGSVHSESKKNTVNSKAAAFNELFELTANEWAGHLPTVLGDDEKVAAVKHLMTMDPDEQAIFVEKLAEESSKLENLVKDEKKHHEGHIPSVAEEHKEKKDDEEKGKKEEMKHEKKEAAESCSKCDEAGHKDDHHMHEEHKEKSEEKKAAAQTKEGRLLRKYVDPYGYKNSKEALPKDAYGYQGKGQKQASDILSKLASLTRK